jgi:hypothetical protein
VKIGSITRYWGLEDRKMCGMRISRLLGKITILVIVGLCVNTAVALDGSGTEEDPWLIQSLEDFNDFAADANYWAGFTRLETDVNLAGMVYERAVIAPDVSSSQFYQGTKYTGVFDGNDHKILNLTIDDGGAGNDWLGLFGSVDNGEVRNLGLEGGSVSGDRAVGGLMGDSKEYGIVSNCYSTNDVKGSGSVGGLIGIAVGGSWLSNCYSTGNVSGTGDPIGGLVGYIEGGVWNCYSTGNVSGDSYVGGLVGQSNNSSISNCYSTGDVNGVELVGGFIGWNGGSFTNCYSTGDVQGGGVEEVGGLVGSNFGYVGDCFWDIDSQNHGITESIGLNGGPVENVEGLPTEQMQTRSTFVDADWDFINVWNIGENQTYPYLRIYLPSDINKDGIVNFLDIAITANQWLQEQQ